MAFTPDDYLAVQAWREVMRCDPIQPLQKARPVTFDQWLKATPNVESHDVESHDVAFLEQVWAAGQVAMRERAEALFPLCRCQTCKRSIAADIRAMKPE